MRQWCAMIHHKIESIWFTDQFRIDVNCERVLFAIRTFERKTEIEKHSYRITAFNPTIKHFEMDKFVELKNLFKTTKRKMFKESAFHSAKSNRYHTKNNLFNLIAASYVNFRRFFLSSTKKGKRNRIYNNEIEEMIVFI